MVQAIAERIKRLRIARHMTQAQLATAIGRDQSVVSDMERGKAFKVDVLPALCAALGVSLDYLIFGDTLRDQADELARQLARLSAEQRDSILAVVRSMTPPDLQ